MRKKFFILSFIFVLFLIGVYLFSGVAFFFKPIEIDIPIGVLGSVILLFLLIILIILTVWKYKKVNHK